MLKYRMNNRINLVTMLIYYQHWHNILKNAPTDGSGREMGGGGRREIGERGCRERERQIERGGKEERKVERERDCREKEGREERMVERERGCR